jgi:hypothetical protein
MRLLFILVLTIINCVIAKNNVKSLTQSLGQEVIEIGVPMNGETLLSTQSIIIPLKLFLLSMEAVKGD